MFSQGTTCCAPYAPHPIPHSPFMPTVSFPLSYLERLTSIGPKILVERAFNYGLEALLEEDQLTVDVTAERPDLLSAEGFTRAMNIFGGAARTVPDQLAELEKHRREYDELSNAAKALETAIQRGYLDVRSGR